MLGESMEERWQRSQELYSRLGLPVRFETYAGTGHTISSEVFRDRTPALSRSCSRFGINSRGGSGRVSLLAGDSRSGQSELLGYDDSYAFLF